MQKWTRSGVPRSSFSCLSASFPCELQLKIHTAFTNVRYFRRTHDSVGVAITFPNRSITPRFVKRSEIASLSGTWNDTMVRINSRFLETFQRLLRIRICTASLWPRDYERCGNFDVTACRLLHICTSRRRHDDRSVKRNVFCRKCFSFNKFFLLGWQRLEDALARFTIQSRFASS